MSATTIRNATSSAMPVNTVIFCSPPFKAAARCGSVVDFSHAKLAMTWGWATYVMQLAVTLLQSEFVVYLRDRSYEGTARYADPIPTLALPLNGRDPVVFAPLSD